MAYYPDYYEHRHASYANGKNDENAYISDTSPGQHQRKKLYKVSEWWLELFAWVLGAALIAGTVYILAHFDNTPVERWPIPIQISTAVAFLAQVVSATLLFPTEACISQLKWRWFKSSRKVIDLQKFDEASRGPLGSLVLLCSLSIIPRLVHLGALVTILMLVFPTFFQQAVQTQLEPLENTTRGASIPRLRQYFRPLTPTAYSSDYIYRSDFTGTPGNNQYLTNTIVSSMVSNTQNLDNVKALCPAGACSWEPYATLAMCYSTEDITSQVMEQAKASTLSTQYITLPEITVRDSPVYPTMWLTTVFGAGNGTIGSRGQDADITAPNLQLTNANSNLDDLAHIYLAYQDPCLMTDWNDTSKESWKAFKATIRLCLQTLKTSHNSSTKTVIAGSFTNLTWTPVMEERNFSTDGSGRINGNWTTRLNDDDFSIDLATADILGGQIATSFNFSASFSPGGDNYLYGSMFASSFVSEVLGPDPLVCPNGTEYGLQAFDKRMANIATGVTNAFRLADSSELVNGKSFRNILFIHVKYWPLTVPGALFLAITIFFLATVISTAKVPVWKSSQLAVLYTMHGSLKLDTKSKMEEEAKIEELSFNPTGNWQLEHVR